MPAAKLGAEGVEYEAMGDVIESLRMKLPAHTFDAVMRRVETLDDEEGQRVLEQIHADRVRGEALDRGEE